jgi:DNA polymerase-3 subunit gamma/tau
MTLKSAVLGNRLPHAVLLVGYNTEQAALELAAAYNCERLPNVCDCSSGNLCTSCRKTLAGVHSDVTRLYCADSTVKIGDIRRLTAKLSVLPLEGRRKPYVITDAALLSPACQNALLAALEEPPAAAAFVLTAEHTGSLLPTVLSRLTRFNLTESKSADYSQEVRAQVAKIINAVQKKDETALLLACLACDKWKREQLSDLLDLLREALTTPDAVALSVAYKLGDLQETLSRNAGAGHLCGALAVTLTELL